jgi:hypothetical protein
MKAAILAHDMLVAGRRKRRRASRSVMCFMAHEYAITGTSMSSEACACRHTPPAF